MQDEEPFFVRDGERFIPTGASAGYWVPGTLNGRAVFGLLGYEFERIFGAPDFVPVRLSVDLLRPVPSAPLHITTNAIRSGRRAIATRAQLWAGETLVAEASCLFARTTANPVEETFQSPNWDVPPPDQLLSRLTQNLELRPIPPAIDHADRSDPSVTRSMRGRAERRTWVRDGRQLVDGIENSPFVRAAMLADFASPLSNSSKTGIDFINSDLTLYLHRLPADEWMGFEFVKHHAFDGIAIGECWLYDETGPLGTINMSAIANMRRPH